MSVPAPCTILTSAIFADLTSTTEHPLYDYGALCTAIDDWNTNNGSNQIFLGATEVDRKNELAAFLGHTLHESGDHVYPREISQCGTINNADGTSWTAGDVYCVQSGSTWNDPYCSAGHTSLTNPAGCDCAAVTKVATAGGFPADEMFFGRGPIQLSWNYNYKSANDAPELAHLSVDLCANPDLVATVPTVAWSTAIWFWMTQTGATYQGPTAHDYVTESGSFGGSLYTINGGLECTTSTSHRASVVSRLNKYCKAAEDLGVGLLSFGDCTDLQTVYDSCIAGGSGTWGTCTACDAITQATDAPTTSPTAQPTGSPTPPQPTVSPTASPTASPLPPTDAPTASPTGSPTPPQPTVSPTASPTASPLPPTDAPTASPTASPTTAQPTPPPTPSPSASPTEAPTIEVTVAGTLTFTPADCTKNYAQDAAFRQVIEDAIATTCTTHGLFKTCTVVIDDITCETSRLRGRGLQTSTLTVEYRVVIDAICSLAGCDGNAQGVQAVADDVYDSVVADLNAAISGFVVALGNASGDLALALTGAVATGDFADVLVPLLEFLSDYYPDWEGGSGKCKNDNKAPAYMKRTGAWYEPTLEACCTRYYGWDMFTCTSMEQSDLSGFFPNWEDGKTECLDASVDLPPGYMRNAPDSWLIDDASDCCKKHYSWDLHTCLANSGLDTSGLATNKWRVSYADHTCTQDCPESSGATCGGHASSWEALYETVDDCCEGKLWWVSRAVCVGESTGTAVALTGSGGWYVDWSNGGKCVKDCPEGGANCGGLAKHWEGLYPTDDECCDRISWLAREECTD